MDMLKILVLWFKKKMPLSDYSSLLGLDDATLKNMSLIKLLLNNNPRHSLVKIVKFGDKQTIRQEKKVTWKNKNMVAE